MILENNLVWYTRQFDSASGYNGRYCPVIKTQIIMSFKQFKEEFLKSRSYIICDEGTLKQAYEQSKGNIDLATDFILSQDLAEEVEL